MRIKVGELAELPPGKGKTVLVAGHEVTVYNREGRYVATAAPMPRGEPALLESTCGGPGQKFDVGVGPAVTPDRLRSADERCHVEIEDDAVYVILGTALS